MTELIPVMIKHNQTRIFYQTFESGLYSTEIRKLGALKVRRHAAAVPKEGDYSTLLNWRKGRGKASHKGLACFHFLVINFSSTTFQQNNLTFEERSLTFLIPEKYLNGCVCLYFTDTNSYP